MMVTSDNQHASLQSSTGNTGAVMCATKLHVFWIMHLCSCSTAAELPLHSSSLLRGPHAHTHPAAPSGLTPPPPMCTIDNDGRRPVVGAAWQPTKAGL
jgi:hypothetical protein